MVRIWRHLHDAQQLVERGLGVRQPRIRYLPQPVYTCDAFGICRGVSGHARQLLWRQPAVRTAPPHGADVAGPLTDVVSAERRGGHSGSAKMFAITNNAINAIIKNIAVAMEL